MNCVREVLTSLKELLSGNGIRELVEHLAIISKFLYKISNAQSHFKFFRAFRKIDRNMMKYTNLGLVQFARKNLELLDGADNFDKSYAEEYTTDLYVIMKRSVILLEIVMRNCLEGVSLCKAELSTQRFIGQNVVLIGSGSKVYCVVKSFVKELKVIYGHLCTVTKRSNNLDALLSSKHGDEEKPKMKRKRKKKNAALKRFGNGNEEKRPTVEKSQVKEVTSNPPEKVREMTDRNILLKMLNGTSADNSKSLLNKKIGNSKSCISVAEDLGEPVDPGTPCHTKQKFSHFPLSQTLPSVLNASEDYGEPIESGMLDLTCVTPSSVLNDSEDYGEDMAVSISHDKSNSSHLTPSQTTLSVLNGPEDFGEKDELAKVILSTDPCEIATEMKKIDASSRIISGNDHSEPKKKRKRKRKKKKKIINNQPLFDDDVIYNILDERLIRKLILVLKYIEVQSVYILRKI